MFKAKLIENESYYKLRSKQLLLILLPSIPFGLLVNFYKIPIWLTIVMFGFYILAIILVSKNQKQMNSILGNKLIEIDEEEIRIKSKTGIQQEVIRLAEIDKLILKKKYSMPQETIMEIGSEINGNAKQNYLIFQKDSKKRKLDFEIDSYFMIEQINKIIEKWEVKGYEIERVAHE
jgi:hypothetical protein